MIYVFPRRKIRPALVGVANKSDEQIPNSASAASSILFNAFVAKYNGTRSWRF